MLRRFAITFFALIVSAPLFAATLGDDGLHKADWMQQTFLDLREDLAEANAQGKRLLIMVEQRGCIYCTKMHEDVYPRPEIDALLSEKFFVLQINMFGDLEVTDFDGEVLPEKEMVRKWGALFTPTLVYLPEAVPEGATLAEAAVATVPGAFGPGTTRHMMEWVLEKGYEKDEPFQKYHARKLEEEQE